VTEKGPAMSATLLIFRTLLPGLAALFVSTLAMPAAAQASCAPGFTATTGNTYQYRCNGTVRWRCWRGFGAIPPRVTKHAIGGNKKVFTIAYRCAKSPPRGRAGPKPKFPRSCTSGFHRKGSIKRGWYTCRRTVFANCRNLFWSSDLARVYPKPGNAFVWTFQYRCQKSPD
jgi:hypothetical protein